MEIKITPLAPLAAAARLSPAPAVPRTALEVAYQADRLSLSPAAAQPAPGLPLFTALPGLARQVRHIPLGSYPTPVERLASLEAALGTQASLFIKRDDLSSPLYGGNKVRKLEFTLGDILAQGSRRIITGGGLGSHMTVAMAAFGRAHGIPVDVAFFRQPLNDHVRQNLRLNAHFGARMEYSRNYAEFAFDLGKRYAAATLADGQRPYLVLPGDSNPLSSLGYVNMAFELKQQIAAGQIPEPDYIFVAAGSGGTMAGLLAGLRLAGLKTKVAGVIVSDERVTRPGSIASLANRTLELARTKGGASLPADPVRATDVILLNGYLGAGYGHATAKSRQSLQLLQQSEQIGLDPTYTSKAMAAMLDFARLPSSRGLRLMFLNTYNSRDLSAEAAAVAPGQLPRDFRPFS